MKFLQHLTCNWIAINKEHDQRGTYGMAGTRWAISNVPITSFRETWPGAYLLFTWDCKFPPTASKCRFKSRHTPKSVCYANTPLEEKEPFGWKTTVKIKNNLYSLSLIDWKAKVLILSFTTGQSSKVMPVHNQKKTAWQVTVFIRPQIHSWVHDGGSYRVQRETASKTGPGNSGLLPKPKDPLGWDV